VLGSVKWGDELRVHWGAHCSWRNRLACQYYYPTKPDVSMKRLKRYLMDDPDCLVAQATGFQTCFL
jgi:hypothetical protein